MIVKVSKKMCDFINKTAKNRGFEARADIVLMPENKYRFFVGFCSDPWTDYDNKTGKIKVIQISYPGNYYACPVYLSTDKLVKAFKAVNGSTLEDLAGVVRDLCEI